MEVDVRSCTGRQSSEELRQENRKEPMMNTRPNRDAVSKSTSPGASAGRHVDSNLTTFTRKNSSSPCKHWQIRARLSIEGLRMPDVA